jgi:signal transduction histidine kinase
MPDPRIPGPSTGRFEPFFTSNKQEGTGLGLAIARRIVEEHGGALWLEEDDKQPGATFVLSLPACESSAC